MDLKWFDIVIALLICSTGACKAENSPWIAAGDPAELGDIPYVVFLNISKIILQEVRIAICTGSIIHPDWILTAAHCTIHNRGIQVHAAYTEDLEEEKSQVRSSVRSVVFPGYENNWGPVDNYYYDFSLIKLNSSLHIDNDTVKLLQLDGSAWKDGTDRICTIVGYGQTDQNGPARKLFFTETKVSHGAGACPCASKGYLINSFICLTTGEDGKSLCPGDSGGPLVCNSQLIGVASHIYPKEKCNLISRKSARDFGCGVDGTVSVHAYVCPVLSWIRGYVGDIVPEQPAQC